MVHPGPTPAARQSLALPAWQTVFALVYGREITQADARRLVRTFRSVR
jgi:hypothetical protein